MLAVYAVGLYVDGLCERPICKRSMGAVHCLHFLVHPPCTWEALCGGALCGGALCGDYSPVQTRRWLTLNLRGLMHALPR